MFNFCNLDKTQCLIKSFLIVNILTLLIEAVPLPEPVFSSGTSRGRFPSFSEITRPKTLDIRPIERASIHDTAVETEARPSASTSELREVELQEHQQPLIENIRRISFAPEVDIAEATAGTHRGREHLDPTRDGVFARMQRLLSRNAVPFASGVAVGAGVIELINIIPNSHKIHPNSSLPSMKASASSVIDDVNGLIKL